MMVNPPKPLNLTQLLAELRAAGVSVGSLGANGNPAADEVFTYDAAGAVADLPAAAAPVVARHVATDGARSAVLGLAQTAVGVQLTALTANQQRAVLACLLYQAGAIDGNLIVRPLGEWLA